MTDDEGNKLWLVPLENPDDDFSLIDMTEGDQGRRFTEIPPRRHRHTTGVWIGDLASVPVPPEEQSTAYEQILNASNLFVERCAEIEEVHRQIQAIVPHDRGSHEADMETVMEQFTTSGWLNESLQRMEKSDDESRGDSPSDAELHVLCLIWSR